MGIDSHKSEYTKQGGNKLQANTLQQRAKKLEPERVLSWIMPTGVRICVSQDGQATTASYGAEHTCVQPEEKKTPFVGSG
jgi:hypothetical protein